MEWLNYHHLFYFWNVVREGSVVAAARKLRLAQPTVSTQIRALEDSLGEALFERQGRRLALTDVGHVVYRYADEIFALGRELVDTLRGRPGSGAMRLVVGIADVVPKLIAHRLLAPALSLDPPVRFVCVEDKTERLLAELSVRGLDLVLADAPVSGQARVRAYNHLLGECGVTFFGAPALAAAHRPGFPGSLDGAPVLVPMPGTHMRRALDQWFEAHGVRPRVAGEFDDSALLKVFGEHGAGLFAAPSVLEDEVAATYGVEVVGRTDEVVERFYAITVERKIKHPAVVAISQAAHETLFAGSQRSSRS